MSRFFLVFIQLAYFIYLTHACTANEDISPFNGDCVCKSHLYRVLATGLCETKKSLQIPQNTGLTLKTFPSSVSDLSLDFTISLWAKPLYSGDGDIVKRDNGFLVKRLNANSAIYCKFSYSGSTNDYTSSAGVVPINTWTHILVMHDGTNSKLKVYAGTNKIIDDNLPGTATLTTEQNLIVGNNIGLVTELYFFKTVKITDQELPLYIYQYFII